MKFGGDPASISNKVALSSESHGQISAFYRSIQYYLEGKLQCVPMIGFLASTRIPPHVWTKCKTCRTVLLHVGAVDAGKLEASHKSGVPLPGLHSPSWAPEREPTIKAAIRAETAILMDLLNGISDR